MSEKRIQWRRVLEWKNLPYFHMVDCAHGSPPFDKLTKDERIDVATRMIAIIKKRAVQGMAVTIDENDFDAVVARYPDAKRSYKTAYTFCSHSILAGVGSWLIANPKVASMAYIFEHGHNGKPQSERVFGNLFRNKEKAQLYRFAGLGYVPKEQSCGVQAADLLAWQWYKDRKNQMEGRPRRKDCASLLELHNSAIHLDRDGIETIISSSPTFMRSFVEAATPLLQSDQSPDRKVRS
jgi:hypothetical protein